MFRSAVQNNVQSLGWRAGTETVGNAGGVTPPCVTVDGNYLEAINTINSCLTAPHT